MSAEAELFAVPESSQNTPDNDDEDGTTSSGDDTSGFPFDLAAAVGLLASTKQVNCSVGSSTSASSFISNPVSIRKRTRISTSNSRLTKKSSLVNQTAFCYTIRGPNSLLRPDKSALFTIGGVYELKCWLMSPPRANYVCKTILSLSSDDIGEWLTIEETLASGTLLSNQPAPNHFLTMDRPSPRTHRNVKAGRHSLEFTWDASGVIFVYLRFLCAVNDLIANPKAPLRLIVQSQFLDEPHLLNMKSLVMETIGHPSLLESAIGSQGAIDFCNDLHERIIPIDHREYLFEQPSDFDDTDFVRNVINNVAKAAAADSPMAVLEKAIQDSIPKNETSSSAQMSAATIGEALGSLLGSKHGSIAPSSTFPIPCTLSSHTPRPRGRPRKFHYPEYCYSKTALERGPAHAGECSGPAAEMIAIQQMQKQHANEAQTSSSGNRIKMNILEEKPINMASLFTLQQTVVEEIDKPSSSMEDVEPNADVKRFLIQLKMPNYINIFAKYTMIELRLLSSEDLRIICGNDAEAIRLYHALRLRSNINGKLSIFVALQNDEGDEPCYELLKLSPPCVSELAHSLRTKGLIDSNVRRLCVDGPNGILVQLSDEIIEAWEDNAVFQFTFINGVLKMHPIKG
ncbi:unnamed protein product, partial [Mesorhabditis belari]|uniref:GRHL1/CP2 C-terminal domain-containing protein n=1 Tax=Mesorhabditis belari TaxID=2138241 RepID=A0AAF3E7X2_9BILA